MIYSVLHEDLAIEAVWFQSTKNPILHLLVVCKENLKLVYDFEHRAHSTIIEIDCFFVCWYEWLLHFLEPSILNFAEELVAL